MDRRYGVASLAPPRPPKSLPRVHRPRAPEPPMMSASSSPLLVNNNNQNQANPNLLININQQQQQQSTNNNRHQSSNNLNIVNSNNIRQSLIQTTNQSTLTSVPTTTQPIERTISTISSPPPVTLPRQLILLPPLVTPITAPLVPLSPSSFLSTTVGSGAGTSGTSSFARRHPPSLSPIPSLSSSIHQTEIPVSPVTLAAPRPASERLANEYVDTPFRAPHLCHHHHHAPNAAVTASRTSPLAAGGQTSSTTTTTASSMSESYLHRHHPHQCQQQQQSNSHLIQHHAVGCPKTTIPSATGSSESATTSGPLGTTTSRLLGSTTSRQAGSTIVAAQRPSDLSLPAAVTKQPVSFAKVPPTTVLHDDVDIHPASGDSRNSITCPQCKRCRCETCQRPRQLPSRWVCEDTCLCSAETIIDYATCLCCVKALYYHCSKDHEMEHEGDSISCADSPCSCLPHKRMTRWGCLGALSLALPCLWCYWPLRGCIAICAQCYARHSRHGCRCPQAKTNNGRTTSRSLACDLTPEKRLLDSSPDY